MSRLCVCGLQSLRGGKGMRKNNGDIPTLRDFVARMELIWNQVKPTSIQSLGCRRKNPPMAAARPDLSRFREACWHTSFVTTDTNCGAGQDSGAFSCEKRLMIAPPTLHRSDGERRQLQQ